MTNEEILIIVGFIIIILLLILILKPNKSIDEIHNLGNLFNETQKNNNYLINERIKEMNDTIQATNEMSFRNAQDVRQQLLDLTYRNELKIDNMKESVDKKLEDIRKSVDEQLQDTLDKKISQSFGLVNERLEQVYKGLGEMQVLANGVGDLKKVLSNVKTRGILGEIQCKAILEEILAPEQYEENVITKKGSKDVVEFAIKLPNDDRTVYLPIDSKFPADKYANLMDAYESGNQEEIKQAQKELDIIIKKCAKDIHDKYIDVPNTTEFAIMFLPFEGLYAEVVNRGLVEILQREYKINIAGPTTLAALLNALQMGFKTLAIQKRSSEVWELLGAVKSEFENFNKVLENTQNRLNMAQKELDQLVGVRTRQIQKKLDKVTSLDSNTSIKLLEEES